MPQVWYGARSYYALLQDSLDISEIGSSFLHPEKWSHFFSLGLNDWLLFNLTENCSGVAGYDWQLLFAIGIWMIWKDRNKLVFSPGIIASETLPHCIINFGKLVMETQLRHSLLLDDQCVRMECLISWRFPPIDYYKLNVDGSVKTPSMLAACGGLIRNDAGEFIKGFYCNLGICSMVKVELWGLYYCLQLAKTQGISKLVVELDSLVALNVFQKKCPSTHHCFAFVRDICTLLQDKWACLLIHSVRKGNKCADYLANLGYSSTFTCTVLEHPTQSLHHLFWQDTVGVTSPRFLM